MYGTCTNLQGKEREGREGREEEREEEREGERGREEGVRERGGKGGRGKE